jgi:hypothetical protein
MEDVRTEEIGSTLVSMKMSTNKVENFLTNAFVEYTAFVGCAECLSI